MRFIFAFFALFFLVGAAAAGGYCSGCGCKGGPGYRGPNGKCVGWKALNKVCGSPPTTRCTAEGPALQASRKLGIASIDDGDSAQSPVASNQLRTLEDGVGCRRTESLEALRACPADSSGCERERALLDGKTCIAIDAGTAVTIEASSRSFDWLRVRVPGVTAPVWTERSLVLGGE